MNAAGIITLLFWGLFYLFDEGKSLIYIFLAASFHESAHIFFYHIFKAKISSVKILPYGISASFHSTVKLSYAKECLSLFAGPFFNLIIAVFCIIINTFIQIEGSDLFFAYNAAYFAVNLLPVFPLDGGRIVRNALFIKFSENTAVKISRISTLFFIFLLFAAAAVLFFYAGNFSLILISVYLLITFFIDRNQG